MKNSQKPLKETYFTRLETWLRNSAIDSSVAIARGDTSLDVLASFASAVGAPDLIVGAAEAFDDPSMATFEGNRWFQKHV